MSKVWVPSFNRMYHCHQLFFIDRKVMVSWIEGSTDEADRVFTMHKYRTNAIVVCIWLDDERLIKVRESQDWCAAEGCLKV